MGIADELAEGDIVEAGLAFAENLIAKGSPIRRIRDEEELFAKPGTTPKFLRQRAQKRCSQNAQALRT